MTTTKEVLALILIGFAALIAVALMLGHAEHARATAPDIAARVATSSTIGVGPQLNKTLFADTATSSIRNLCSARIISTVASPVMLSFDPNMTAGPTVGILQPASTTTIYPADWYGCGPVTAYAFSSTTISEQENRW